MKYWLCWLLLQSLLVPAYAGEADLLRTKDKTALDFERVTVEENLKAKILGVVTPLIPNTRFNLTVAINYKIEKPKAQQVPNHADSDYVELGKFGVVAPPVSDQLLHQDLISNIGFIRITFLFYDHVDEELAGFLTQSVKKLIDIVPVWRLRVEMVIPPKEIAANEAKPVPQTAPLHQTSWLFAGLVVALAIGLLFSFMRLRHDVHSLSEALRSMRGGNFEEAVYHRHAEPPPPPPRPEPHREPVEVVEVQSRDESSTSTGIIPVAAVNQAMEFLAISSPASEEQIFNALARAGRVDLLQKAAQTYFPASLVWSLSDELLARAFAIIDIQHKTGLMLTLPEQPRYLLMNSLSGTAKAFFEHELQNAASDPAARLEAAQNADLHWKMYVDAVRQLLRSYESPPREAQDLVRDWINEKIRTARRAG